MQDLAMLSSLAKRKAVDKLRSAAALQYNHTSLSDWWNPRPAFADQPTYEWIGSAFDDATRPAMSHLEHIDPAAWTRVRQYMMRLAAEEK
jgi:hypothetical protein